jgi:hypothetical protein
MGIKNKKRSTENAYRLKKIEDYLISQGYVCISYIEGVKGVQRWVDCVQRGYDITFDPNNEIPEWDQFTKEPRGWQDSTFRPLDLDSQFFFIHMEHGASGSADDVESAVRKSRTRSEGGQEPQLHVKGYSTPP